MEKNKNKFGNNDKDNYNTKEDGINLLKSQSEDLRNINTCANSESIHSSKVESSNTDYKLTRSNSDDHEYNNKKKLKLIIKNTIEINQNFKNNSSSYKLSLKKNHTSKNSIWGSFKNKISNIKNNLKYNTLTTNSFINFYESPVIKLYNKIYITKTDLNEFCKDIYYLIYMSYRSDFLPIEELNQPSSSSSLYLYTTDCGWGCMIRAAQMILARGIQLIKQINAPQSDGEKLDVIIETILLFLDDYIPYKDLKNNQGYLDLVEQVIKQLDMVNLEIKSNNKIEIENVVESVLPPFSIQNICKVGELLGTKPGEWFSDVTMINIFLQLNDELHPIKNLELINFSDGVIYGNIINAKCFFENRNSAGIIFLSFRLGLEKFSEFYFENIKKIFNISFNIGIIGGVSDNAHYYIGTAGDYLLYLDPHFNQKKLNSKDLKNKNYVSYLKKLVYQTHFKKLSPAFTIGFYFRNKEECEILVEELKKYSEDKYALFHFKNEEKKDGKEESDIEFVNNLGDDF